MREAVANLHQDDFALAGACRSVHLSCESRNCHVGKRAAHKHFPISSCESHLHADDQEKRTHKLSQVEVAVAPSVRGEVTGPGKRNKSNPV